MKDSLPKPPTGHKKRDRGNRRPSKIINVSDVPQIKKRIKNREFLNRIAADYDVNPGRISDIKNGKKFADIPAAR